MVKEQHYSHISISLITPVYNEEKGLQHAIDVNLDTMNRYFSDFEIIIVNDGSSDASQDIIDINQRIHPHLICFQKERNEGFGSAVRKGIQLASKSFVLPIPVDSPLDNETLKRLMAGLNDNDIVVGCRKERIGYSLRMKLNSWAFQKIIRYLFKIRLKDYNWIHMYRRDVFISNGIDIRSKGIMMLAEVLIKANRHGLKMEEVEVNQKERLTGTATASKISAVLLTIREIFNLYREIGRKQLKS